jgi:hypothetical protein
MSDTQLVGVDRLVSAYIKLRDKKNEAAKKLRDLEAEYDAKLDTLKDALLEHCAEAGVESVRTSAGTFYRTVKKRFWTSDWEAMNKFMVENDAVDLLEKRIHQGNMKVFLDENPDLLPPGLNVDSEYTVNVRRAKK